ncbi:SH2 domain-containing adapter protein D [Ambystoma mexicanum]|uniref:SH2 domain-containing adapter protein D n=1 Tax=Ambystoma mexicanum TaxID=8296 RepID=UPI0037E86469
MARWLRDYLSLGSRRSPPQPPTPDYSESDILRAYRAQKSLDFEDPYEDYDRSLRAEVEAEGQESPSRSVSPEVKYVSPKHRLIKVDSTELKRSKTLAATAAEPLSRTDKVTENSEYSDPFDAQHKLEGRDAQGTPPPESNGYMEPYEAQRVIADCHWRGDQEPQGTRKSIKTLQLYDTPYEAHIRADIDPEVSLVGRGRESRLPQDDERPADEYDQPWEWKKDNISRAFAVQFESPAWDLPPAHSMERLQQSRQRSPLLGGCRHANTISQERRPSMGERVDHTIPLERQPWFHGAISRVEAETMLVLCRECSYLVRSSETSHKDYCLSIRCCQGFMHMKLTQTKESKYIVGQNSAAFSSIPEVIHYYTTRKLPIKGAEHLSLLYPVTGQTL